MGMFVAYYGSLPPGRFWWKPLLAYGATFSKVQRGDDGAFVDIPMSPKELAEDAACGIRRYQIELAGISVALNMTTERSGSDGSRTLYFHARRFVPLETMSILAKLDKKLVSAAFRNAARVFGRILLASGGKEYDECMLCRSIFQGGEAYANRMLRRMEEAGIHVARTPPDRSLEAAYRTGRALDELARLPGPDGDVSVLCGVGAGASDAEPAPYVAIDLEKGAGRRRASVRVAAMCETFLIEAGLRPLDVVTPEPEPEPASV